MTRPGRVARASSNSSSSIDIAYFEKTLNLTPPGPSVAPSDALVPASMTSVLIIMRASLGGWRNRTRVPDLACVLSNRAVRRKARDPRRIADRQLRPVALVAVRVGDALLAVDVR